MERPQSNSSNNTPLASFFVLAYAITWTLQLAAIFLAPARGMALSNETNFLYFLDLLGGRLNSAQAGAFSQQPVFKVGRVADVKAFEEVAPIQAQGICQDNRSRFGVQRRSGAEGGVEARGVEIAIPSKFNRIAGEGQFGFKKFFQVGKRLAVSQI